MIKSRGGTVASAMRGNWFLLAMALASTASCLVARECLRRLMEYETLMKDSAEDRLAMVRANAAEILANLGEEDSTTS